MAFPWEVIRSANLATGSIVEDIKLGLDLAQAGKSPLFCPSAVVTSKFPLSIEGAKAQRRRWEEGHVSTIFATLPRFIYQAIARRNFNLLVLSLDLAVPPLSLLILLLIGTNIVAWIGVFCGVSSAAPLIGGFCIIAMASAILLAWVKYGRDILSLSAMHSIVSYIVAKLPIYRQLFSSRAASSWTRTEREKNE
jgi:cellulose synthase/poly-beta-1,6-N-acetylglucosamine synthase-like glycosyltransferase